MSRRAAFTLIELLVVIAIIALLMGILIPVLHKAREQGKDVICRSNMRQIGLGANLYAEDNDLYVPRGASGGTGRAWYQIFMPFLAQKPVNNDYRSVDIYRCPSYPDKQQTVCFVINGWSFRDRNDKVGSETTKPTKLTTCKNRAGTICLADNENGQWRHIIRTANDQGTERCDVWNPGHLPVSNSEDVTLGRRVARARHKNGCNVLFLDWRVDWMAAEDVTVDMWRFER
jgi:prepilin-type N-terminal cleavage/methylation domain-containing protein/prepilin-type processing-associated H-X9-DG protein